MALAYAIIVLAVVGGLIFGVTQFRSAVTHSTELAAQEVNAQAAAEAGYAAALAELQANALFRTHDVAQVANADALARDPLTVPVLTFGKPLAFESRVAAAANSYSGLERSGGGPGDYTFNVGRGLGPTVGRGFDATFRVKVAPVALPGWRRPVIAIESRGKFDQRAVSLVTFLEAGGVQQPAGGVPLDPKYPALSSVLDDYLLVDGEVLDPALGHPDAPFDQVVLAQGGLYGAQGVQLAGGGAGGSRLALKRLGGIDSGAGVWLADPLDVTFWDPSRPGETTAPLHVPGGDRPDPNNPAGDLFEPSAGRVRDHRHGGKLALPDLAAALDRAAADHLGSGGIDLGLIVAAGAPDDGDSYDGGAFIRKISNFTNPYGPAGETIELCFGRPSYLEGVTGEPDPIAYSDHDPDPLLTADHPAKPSKPAAFLFARGYNVVVWGCPDRDVTIYTDRDLYVAGDFNQSPWHHQIYTSQDPASAKALDEDGRATRYVDPVRFAGDADREAGSLDDQEAAREGSSPASARLDRKSNVGLFQERKLARLAARGRVWLDYRHPSRLLANELIPWIAFQLAAHLSSEPAALAAARYASLAEVSRHDKATQWTINAPLAGFRDAAGNATPAAARFVKDALFLDPASSDAAVKEAAGKASAILLAELGTAPTAAKLQPTAERLMYRVLAPLEKRTQVGGLYKLAQAYRDQVFPADDRHAPPFAAGDPRLSRFYLPEMTVNAQLVDSALRTGDWDRASRGKKPLPEIGNGPATGVYLKGDASWAPLLTRVYGSEMHLRQVPPDPPLAITTDVRAATPPLRRRVFARSQGRWIGASLRFGSGGDAGLPCVFRVLSRRESVLSAERGAADQSLANWP